MSNVRKYFADDKNRYAAARACPWHSTRHHSATVASPARISANKLMGRPTVTLTSNISRAQKLAGLIVLPHAQGAQLASTLRPRLCGVGRITGDEANGAPVAMAPDRLHQAEPRGLRISLASICRTASKYLKSWPKPLSVFNAFPRNNRIFNFTFVLSGSRSPS